MVKNVQIVSPSGNISVFFSIEAMSNKNKAPNYKILSQNSVILEQSPMGFKLKNEPKLKGPFEVISIAEESSNQIWNPLYGEKIEIPDIYNQSTIIFKEKQKPFRLLHIIFRVYDEGVAFRYYFPNKIGRKTIIIKDEYTSFNFPNGCMGYEEHGTEGKYQLKEISQIKKNCERPLTVVYKSGDYASILEANTYDYSRMLLGPSKQDPQILKVNLGGTTIVYPGYGIWKPKYPFQKIAGSVEKETPFYTPWRVILISSSPGDLLEHSYIISNLNEPNKPPSGFP